MKEMPMGDIPAYWARERPDAAVLVHEDKRMSWNELERSASRLARAYQQLGVRRGSYVTIGLPNSIEFFLACFAAWKLGATPQPISAKVPKLERDAIIELAEPALVVGVDSDQHLGFRCVPVGYQPDAGLSDASFPAEVAKSYKAMTSGGSTGRPKLIVSGWPSAVDLDMPFLNIGSCGCVLIPGPLYHNGPFMWGMHALFGGNSIVLTTRFDAEQVLALIARERVDTIYLVPTMMQRIWNLGESVRTSYDLSSLRTLWHLAAPCPAWLKQAYIDWFGADCIWELYGGTESTGSTIISGEEWLQHRGSVGRPTAECAMKIVGTSGETLPPGEVGEVFIRPLSGPGTTYTYIGAEAKVIDDGWESLGDMGYMDTDGYLYLTDRHADMILSGGANIYPAEVEAAIDAFPGVRSCAVIGLPHPDLGNAIHAIIDMPDGPASEEALTAHLTERLVRYKIPRSFEFVTEPIRDDAGKVRRRALRDARVQD